MSTFKDNSGREWSVNLDGPTIREVRKLGIDLAAVDGSASEKLRDDPVLLVDSLWVICRAQAQAVRVTDSDFGKSLVGDAIEFATEALIDFSVFPKNRRFTPERFAELTVERMKWMTPERIARAIKQSRR